MSDDVFTDPTEATEDWTDVRMTDPDAGEWDVDVVVAGGRVEFVDLRIRPNLLEDFVDCLIDDVDEQHGRKILETVADRQNIEIDAKPAESQDD